MITWLFRGSGAEPPAKEKLVIKSWLKSNENRFTGHFIPWEISIVLITELQK